AGQASADGNRRKLYLRERGNRQEAKGERASKENRQREKRGGDRAPDKRPREIGGDIQRSLRGGFLYRVAKPESQAPTEPIKSQESRGGGIGREQLAQEQAADDGDTERPAKLRAGAGVERQRKPAEQSRHGGHHDGAEAKQAGLVDGI